MKFPTQNNSAISLRRYLKFMGTAAAGITFTLSAAQAFQWNGNIDSDITNNANYSNPSNAPTYGSANTGSFFIANGVSGSALTYGAAQGTTSFSGGSFRVGANSGGGGAPSSILSVTGGNLTFTSSGTSTVGFAGSGTINVSGGALTVNGGDEYWFGNNLAATANVSGGTFTVGNTFLFSRDGGGATLNLTGNGVFDVTGALGTNYGSGTASINLSNSAIFRQTGSNAIDLGGNFFVNFATPGSSAQFSLLGSNTASLNSLISAGNFRINGTISTNLSDFVVTGAANGTELGTITAVPEPSTTGFAAIALIGLVILARRRRMTQHA